MTNPGGPTEHDTIEESILPVVRAAGWVNDQIVREYALKAQRVMSSGGVSRNIGDRFADRENPGLNHRSRRERSSRGLHD